MNVKGSGNPAWVRNALSVALAYVLLLQVVIAGIAAERMSFAAIGAPDGLCTSAATQTDHEPAQPLNHSDCCAICAFHGLAPVLPAPVGFIVPWFSAHSSRNNPSASRVAPKSERHDPRSSQGPPLTA